MKLSIVVKALNEEANIARAIESSLRTIEEVGSGEVILADSLSTDRTIDIARGYPIRVVQLTHGEDRCCGVGAQLGFEIAQGEFIYILDGDMEFEPGFMAAAIACMESDPGIGGVGGKVREMVLANEEFRKRATKITPHMQPGRVDRLNMGGLYRRAALEQSGYFTNRNLHACEEFELAARLNAGGWRLRRLAVPAVRHYGHAVSSYRLLLRRLRTKYLCGYGEILRQSWGQPHFGFVLRRLEDLRQFAAVALWWCALLGVWALHVPVLQQVSVFLALLVFPFAVMVVRKGSLNSGLYSVAAWNFGTLGLLCGLLLTPKGAPEGKLRSRVLQ